MKIGGHGGARYFCDQTCWGRWMRRPLQNRARRRKFELLLLLPSFSIVETLVREISGVGKMDAMLSRYEACMQSFG